MTVLKIALARNVKTKVFAVWDDSNTAIACERIWNQLWSWHISRAQNLAKVVAY